MTKRIIISIVLLLLAVSLSVSSYILLRSKISVLGEALDNAIYAESIKEENLLEIEKYWSDNKRLFQVFLLHSDLTELQSEINGLREIRYIPDEYKKSCVRSKALLQAIEDSIKIRIENIL